VHDPHIQPCWQQFWETQASPPPFDEPDDELDVEPLPELELLPDDEDDEDDDEAEPDDPEEECPEDEPLEDESPDELDPPSCTVPSPVPPSSLTVFGWSMPRTEAHPTANARAIARQNATVRAAPRNAIVRRMIRGGCGRRTRDPTDRAPADPRRRCALALAVTQHRR
jgi:hypothetical protein